jgi:predicted ATPase
MKLKLQNIGIIEEADINVDGITLIAGQNDSGKSTVGKVLYALIKGFNQDENLFREEKNRAMIGYYQDILKELKKIDSLNISDYQTKEINTAWIGSVEKLLDVKLKMESRETTSNSLAVLKNIIESKYDTVLQQKNELENWFRTEFAVLQNIFNNSKEESKIQIEDLEGVTTIERLFKNLNSIYLHLHDFIETYFKEAYYIESPQIVDDSLRKQVGRVSNQSYIRDRQEELAISLSNALPTNKLDYSDIYSQITNIINGEITIDLFNGVRYKKNNQEIDIKNTAVGIKSFGIIQLLLKNNRLNNRTLLIIDEPEVHLHPTWQVKYAEILVLLSKEFGIPMVLTSHSPYFIEALDAYVKKYNYEKSTNFYFAKKNEDGLSAKIIDVTENIMPILSSISEAFYEIQDINDED